MTCAGHQEAAQNVAGVGDAALAAGGAGVSRGPIALPVILQTAASSGGRGQGSMWVAREGGGGEAGRQGT